ncbi:hypothetical protein ANN_25327 [Periplaneta americana]|uniref:Reverse transcriptase domain-containing protein n=1 Tax=Periplaneta americana TaxID=6978 RepID=A0ABQ8S107_PERAM|nr:hypothetical protein ANN_25327 [Periplaneta americana]
MTSPVIEPASSNANWSDFRTAINGQISTLLPPCDFHTSCINKIIDDFSALILKSAEKSVTKTLISPHRKSVPWWNESCKLAVKNKNRAFYKYKRKPTVENKINFQKLRAIARKTIKDSKKASWLSYLSSMSHQTPQHIIWDRLRKIRGINRNTYISAICQPNSNVLVTNPQDIANTLADTFSKISSDCNYEQDFLHIKNNAPELDPNEMNCNTDQSFNDILTLREVQDTLSHSKNNSPGPDNIPYEFLKQLPPDGVLYLYEVYNYIWSKQVFPDQWRNAIIIPILKPDKNRSAPENYRPIALTCTMCKLLEKIINKRLRWTLEQRNFFTTSQNGFRQFHSTIDSLITLESEILNAFLNKQHLLAVNLDIHKAYDMVWRQYVVKVLIKNQITGNMIRFIHNFLQNRTIQVKVNGTLSKKVIINNGVPQGSVISVTLFLVAINNITSHVSLPAKTCLFADDLTIFCTGKNLTTTQDIIQSSVKGIENWAKETGFKFSANKSECILFSKRNTPHAQPQLYLNNNKLPIVNTIKFLGIIFDRKLTWAPQLAALKEDCLRRISF